MPEGASSIADLVVRIKSDTQGLQTGLSSVTDLMKNFDGFTGGSLKGLIDLGEKGGASIGGLVGRLAEVGGKITKIGEVLNLAGDVARQVASAAGGGDEFANIEQQAAGVQTVLTALAQQGLAEVRDEAKQAAAALGLYSASAAEAGESSENFVERGLAKTAEVIRNIKLDLATLRPAGSLDINTEGELLDRTIAKIDELKRRAAEAAAEMARMGEIRGPAISDPQGDADRQLKNLEMQAWLLGQFQAMERIPWAPDEVDQKKQEEALARLADEVRLLEKKASLLGAGAAASAAELTRERILTSADRGGYAFAPEKKTELNELLKRQEQAQFQIDTQAKAERQDAGADRVIENLVRSIEAERSRRLEIGLSVGEVAALRAQEQALAQIRALGRNATDAERIAIRAAATEKGREAGSAQSRLEQSSAVLSRNLERAFGGWIDGSETNWRGFVATMLSDFAKLTFQANVLQPLLGGGGGGLGGGGGGGAGIIGSLIGGLFGGFMEDGGSVEKGKAYIVGEKRPELFIPNTSGRIEPRIPTELFGGAGRGNGAAAAPISIVTNIDARGATQDAVAQMRSMLAERDAALPNQILSVSREGRERGVT